MSYGPKQLLFRGTIVTTIATVNHYLGITDDAALLNFAAVGGSTPEVNQPLLNVAGAIGVMIRLSCAAINGAPTIQPASPGICFGGAAGPATAVFPGGVAGTNSGQAEVVDSYPAAAFSPTGAITEALAMGVMFKPRQAAVTSLGLVFLAPHWFVGFNTTAAAGSFQGVVVEAKCLYPPGGGIGIPSPVVPW